MSGFPSAQDYCTAVQDPASAFSSEVLRAATFAADRTLGIPIPASGSSAVVFKAHVDGSDHALRFFLREDVSDRSRYSAVSDHVATHGLEDCITAATWRDEAITVHGKPYPMIEMQWINGRTLESYVEHLIDTGNTAAITTLSKRWRELIARLQSAEFAHGDLQHGNILVDQVGALRLVDLDGCWISGLAGQDPPHESGHPNYQHPGRVWGPTMDTFPALVIYTALLALAKKPALWSALHDGEDTLFKAPDFCAPGTTRVWRELAAVQAPQLQTALQALEARCSADQASTGSLETLLHLGSASPASPCSTPPSWWVEVDQLRNGPTATTDPGEPIILADGDAPLPSPPDLKQRVPRREVQPVRRHPPGSGNGTLPAWPHGVGPAATARAGEPKAAVPCPKMPAQPPSTSRWSRLRPANLGSGRRRAVVVALLVLLSGTAVAASLWPQTPQVELLRTSEKVSDAFDSDGSPTEWSAPVPPSSPQALGAVAVSGDTERLYRGRLGTPDCNRSTVAKLLDNAVAVKTAWASAPGSDPLSAASSATGYVAHLTPVTLRDDIRVGTYRLADGQAEPFQAVLQAGTSVLVDEYGRPRVRCLDASPLSEPQITDEDAYRGSSWATFSAGHLKRITKSSRSIPQFGLYADGAQDFRRPAGTTGEADFAQVPSTATANGLFYLSGNQTSCDFDNCNDSRSQSLSVTVTSCPACQITSSDWNGNIPLTFTDGRWRASGAVLSSYTCGDKPVPTNFTFTATVTSAAVVEGVWTATAFAADYGEASAETYDCAPGAQTWSLSGTRG